MAGEDGCIQPHHLPDDFLEDLRSEQLLAMRQSAAEQDLAARQVTSAAAESGDLAAPAGAPGVPGAQDRGSLKDLQATAIRSALDQHGGNVSAAARALGISRNTLYRSLRAPRA